jgi:heterodisulfide reductase subunit B
MNLDAYQNEMVKQYGKKVEMPILYFTQLAGLAMGLSPKELDLDKHFTDPLPMLKNKGLA